MCAEMKGDSLCKEPRIQEMLHNHYEAIISRFTPYGNMKLQRRENTVCVDTNLFFSPGFCFSVLMYLRLS